jgi:hypothetical protein
VFLQFDYYIMLVLSYFVINFITFKKKVKWWVKVFGLLGLVNQLQN